MKRSKYSLSYYNLLAAPMGYIVPIGLTEVLAGDTFKHHTSALIRLNAMVHPVMHPLKVTVHHWFVPHRLVWEDWEDFITGGSDGMDNSVLPYFEDAAVTEGSCHHFLGVTPGYTGKFSALPMRGLNLIFNEWYRDQDLVSERAISLASGLDNISAVSLPRAAWLKDYFTTSRPWTQKGPDVTIPMAITAPLQSNGQSPTMRTLTDSFNRTLGLESSTGYVQSQVGAPSMSEAGLWGSESGLEANLSDTPGGINELRLAFALQRYEEARARYGSRYTEYLRYLGVKSSDARLQRPEYLGGGKSTIQFSEVIATAEGTNVDVGDLKGHGIGSMQSNKYVRFFEEHGYVHTFMHVQPIPVYAQGMDRTYFRETKEDFFQKELQYIGQQEVYRKEVYAIGNPTQVFGYQDRYAEYRQGRNRVSGKFFDTNKDWHMARIFSEGPTLNSSFVESNPTMRIFADQTQEPLQIMAKHSLKARRLVGPGGKSFVL